MVIGPELSRENHNSILHNTGGDKPKKKLHY